MLCLHDDGDLLARAQAKVHLSGGFFRLLDVGSSDDGGREGECVS